MGKRNELFIGFLKRLGESQAGNTLMIVAAALLPILGLAGGGIDMSRLYLTRARIQQACDAGALAGRKQMGSGAWSANSNKANSVAQQLFDANFSGNPYGTENTTRTFAEDDGKVSGTASVDVPMTVMKIFGQNLKTIAVTCDAEMRIPNTDVMFVLDTTGSMGDTNAGDTAPKINGLRNAVDCFYEALAKIDTSVNCGSTPVNTNNPNVQLRFGFVPYSVNVNVGRLLNNDWMADSWTYQSRAPTSPSSWGSWTTYNTAFWGNCPSGNTTAIQYRNQVESTSGGKIYCASYQYRNVEWVYRPVAMNVSGLKAGGYSWNNSIDIPTGPAGANQTVNWDGCIEERQTVRASSYAPIPVNAFDLDIDMIPDTSNAATQWGPMLPDAVWGRVNGSGSNTYSNFTTSTDQSRNNTYYCPQPARRLQTWPSASAFETYVNALTPNGNTYHDIGLIWGARLLSPTGLFASDNAFTPNGGQIERHLIFMTDGDTVTGNENYTAYGVPWWDRRTTTTSSAPSSTALDNQVNLRFSAICSAIKNQNITLWVISFGSGVNVTSINRLKACASSSRFYNAANSAQLIDQFKAIADEISQLRLTS